MGNRTTIHEVGEGGSSRRRQGRSLRAVCGGPDPGAGHRPAACEGARTRALRLDHLHDQALFHYGAVRAQIKVIGRDASAVAARDADKVRVWLSRR